MRVKPELRYTTTMAEGRIIRTVGLTREEDRLIQQAAHALGSSVAAFMRRASLDYAKQAMQLVVAARREACAEDDTEIHMAQVLRP